MSESEGASRNVSNTGDIIGSVISTGDNAHINNTASDIRVELPSREDVDISAAVQELKAALGEIVNDAGERAAIEALFTSVEREAAKDQPDEDTLGQNVEKVLKTVETFGRLTDSAEKFRDPLVKTVGWLGRNWHKLLPYAGVAAIL